MNNVYVNELMESIKHAEIWKATSVKAKDYTDGVALLLDVFLEHKSKQSGLFFIGNGGSSAIASHMTADFMKNGGMRTYSLYDSAVMTCMGNDYGYGHVFSNPMGVLLKENDLVVAISSSGTSLNIINAIKTAKAKKAEVITFTGFRSNNKIKQMGDFNVYIPCEKYGIVESIHNLMLQQIVDLIMERDGIRF